MGNLIWEAYETARDDKPLVHIWDDDGYKPHTWDYWREQSLRVAAGLRRRGVEPGTRVAAVLTNTADVGCAVIGAWLAGAVLVSLPTPRRGQEPFDYLAQLQRIWADSQAHVLLIEQRFLTLLGDRDLGIPVAAFDSLAADGPFEPTPPADDEVAFVQYSSGSTKEPSGCMLTMGAISEQERMIQERLRVDGDTVGVSWLPFSHDMGLFGSLLLTWVSGMRGWLGSPERFLRQPGTWFEDCAEVGGHLTMGPSFGLSLAVRRARTRPPQGVIPLRAIILGGERIEWDTLLEAEEVLGPHGLTLDTMLPAYGLAEAALAVSMKRIDGRPPTVIHADAPDLYAGRLTPAEAGADDSLAVVSCGPPVDGAEVRIEGDGPVGRICVRSRSLALGYLGDEELTRRSIVDGELVTNDLGFLDERGELHVIGRTDDVIAVGGRNVHARDAERLVERCEGVRTGCAALLELAEPSGARMLLAVEARGELSDGGVPLAQEAAEAAYRAVGLRVEECVFLAPGTMPKTPSGKIQRFRCRTLVRDGAEAIVARVAL